MKSITINVNDQTYAKIEAIARSRGKTIESTVLHGVCGYARRYNKMFNVWKG